MPKRANKQVSVADWVPTFVCVVTILALFSLPVICVSGSQLPWYVSATVGACASQSIRFVLRPSHSK